MLTPLKLWRKVDDKLAIYAVTILGVACSIAWPWLMDMAFNGLLPRLSWTDVVRLCGASVIAIILAANADKEGTHEQRTTKAAVKRRLSAAWSRGFGWQAAIAAVTATATGSG